MVAQCVFLFPTSDFPCSLHDRRFMSQAGRTSRASRSCRAQREISRSPRFAHKTPVMQAIFREKSTEMDDKTVNVIVKKVDNNFPWSVLISTIEMTSKCSKL